MRSKSRDLRSLLTLIGLVACGVAGCSGVHPSIPPAQLDTSSREREAASTLSSTGMCSIYAGFGSLSGCYAMSESSGTTLTDGSSAGHNGTISSAGVTYHAAGLTTNSTYAETTNGSTGSMTSGFSPPPGSFSVSFFISLHANANNFGHLASTGSPGSSSPSSGWNIDIDENSSNSVFAKIGYGTGEMTIDGAALPLNEPVNVTMTYDASTKDATLCVGKTSSPSCASGRLPAAYVASGKPIVFGGGTSYYPVDATFDAAAYWSATVLSGSQIDTIAADASSSASAPPTPEATSSAYAPRGGTVPYFPTSPFNAKIPNPPAVNASNAAWVSSLDQGGNFTLNTINVAGVEPNDADHNYTIYYNHSGENKPVTIHCTLQYVSGVDCNDEGMTVYIDSREKIQNNDVSGQDDHLVLIDPAAGYEYVFWRIAPPFPPTNGTLTAAYSGRCALSGDGFTNPSYASPSWNVGCVGDESGYPLSVGIVRPEDLEAALDSSSGSLPQALSFGITCPGKANNGALPAPFLGTGSGTCDNATHPIEGNRLYLAMHDSDVNALGLPKITSVILRTLDEDHFGGYLTDTGGSQPGIQIYGIADNSYLTWGANDPWRSWFLPEAKAEGLPGASSHTESGIYRVGLPIPSSVTGKVRFL